MPELAAYLTRAETVNADEETLKQKARIIAQRMSEKKYPSDAWDLLSMMLANIDDQEAQAELLDHADLDLVLDDIVAIKELLDNEGLLGYYDRIYRDSCEMEEESMLPTGAYIPQVAREVVRCYLGEGHDPERNPSAIAAAATAEARRKARRRNVLLEESSAGDKDD